MCLLYNRENHNLQKTVSFINHFLSIVTKGKNQIENRDVLLKYTKIMTASFRKLQIRMLLSSWRFCIQLIQYPFVSTFEYLTFTF